MTQAPRPTYAVASYTVRPTGFAEVSHRDKHRWCLTVADAGDGWAIRRHSMCLDYRDQWEFEPPATVRDAAFLHRCRFNERAALLRAQKAVDRLTVRGETFADFRARLRAEATVQAQEYLELEHRRNRLQRLTQRILNPQDSGSAADRTHPHPGGPLGNQ